MSEYFPVTEAGATRTTELFWTPYYVYRNHVYRCKSFSVPSGQLPARKTVLDRIMASIEGGEERRQEVEALLIPKFPS